MPLELIERRQLGAASLVVESPATTATCCKNFVERGIPVLGIDPGAGAGRGRDPGRRADAPGLSSARDLAGAAARPRGERADLIIANNVLAHVADLNGFVAASRILLKPRRRRGHRDALRAST